MVKGKFQSDEHPWCAAGFVPLELSDPLARDLIEAYARRREHIDPEFTRNLLEALERTPEKKSKEKKRRVTPTEKKIPVVPAEKQHVMAASKAPLPSGRSAKHGHARDGKRSPEHRSWCGMRSRCEHPQDPKYPYCGGRGISVCKRWRESFPAFLEDMGRKPTGFLLNRIDTDGDFEPGNCRWVTRSQQEKNKKLKTHCKHGHEFTESNTRSQRGRRGMERICRTCVRIRYQKAQEA